MPHVKVLMFHGCKDPAHYSKWNKLINRKDSIWKGVNSNTKVCSNHFLLGKPFPDSPHPCMYMKGYEAESEMKKKRLPPRERCLDPTRSVSRKKLKPEPADQKSHTLSSPHSPHQTDPCHHHSYSIPYHQVCDQCSPLFNELMSTIKNMQDHIEQLEMKLDQQSTSQNKHNESSTDHISHSSVQNQIENKEETATGSCTKKRFSIDDIKDKPSLVNLHTGLQNYETFRWVSEEVSYGAENICYYRGNESHDVKSYQLNNTRKPGKERQLTQENELLLTLMRIKLDLLDEYLAFIFGISESSVSQILSTWIPLLSHELSGLIYWPKQEEVLQAYPKCFSKYETVRAIIDCTEVAIQRPSLASANSQIFSTYKNKPTAKFLLACTPSGTVSFVSEPAGGRMSDKELTDQCGICQYFQPGDICLADRGFTIQDLLLPHGARLVIPPFTQKGKQFTPQKAEDTKTVSSSYFLIIAIS